MRPHKKIALVSPPGIRRRADGTLAASAALVACLWLVGCDGAGNGSAEATALADSRAAAPRATEIAGPPAGVDLPKDEPECCKVPEAAPTSATASKDLDQREAQALPGKFRVPHVALVNQDGQTVRLYEDLVKDRVVVMNFIFTTCRGICPPLGANFAALQKQLGEGVDRNISLVSISVDPTTDTPQRLKAWAGQFGARPGWTLLTGPKADADSVLKSLGVFSANKTEHSPYLLIGSESAGHWTRVHGLTAPQRVAEIARQLARETQAAGGSEDGPRAPASRSDVSTLAAQRYFTDVTLVDQRGEEKRLYSDLLHDRIVVIHPFFAECKGSCPRMVATIARIQDHLADRVGKDVHLISISVDPGHDTPERLAEYAAGLKARAGWYFLAGPQPNVDTALQKLGLRVAAREEHSNLFLVGNLRTGLWKKVMGLADPADIIAIVDGVLEDRPTTAPDSLLNPTEQP
jgi:cytochrome oxidase Cu insertion factor (SCO1/SenC/PrrC family)